MRTRLSILYTKPTISRLLDYLKQKEGVRRGGDIVTKQSLVEKAIWDLAAKMCKEHNCDLPTEMWEE